MKRGLKVEQKAPEEVKQKIDARITPMKRGLKVNFAKPHQSRPR